MTELEEQPTLAGRFHGCLLGLAVGDALGTTLEFTQRGHFLPLTDMIGGGPFGLQPGQWTDDTSMALCLATSLVECGRFDARDQMERYWRWYSHGYLSSTGRCFDIGGATRQALEQYHRSGEPFSGSSDPQSAGNGSIMRLAPVVLFYYPDRDQVVGYSAQSSRTTHAAQECLDACRLMGHILYHLLDGAQKNDALAAVRGMALASPRVGAIAAGSYARKSIDEIRGSGYVVDSLEAALWCFWHTGSFTDAVLQAANLGDDADTTAAVCGQFAGAYYGEHGIPARWLERLAMRDEITRLADGLKEKAGLG